MLKLLGFHKLFGKWQIMVFFPDNSLFSFIRKRLRRCCHIRTVALHTFTPQKWKQRYRNMSCDDKCSFKKSSYFFLCICFFHAVLHPLSHSDATIHWTKLPWSDLIWKPNQNKINQTQNLGLVCSTILQIIIWHNVGVGEQQCRNGALLKFAFLAEKTPV